MFRQYRNYAMLMYLSKPKTAKAVFSALAPSLNNNELDNLEQKQKNRRSQKLFRDKAGIASSPCSATQANTIQQTTSKCKACNMRHALKDC
jgi:hypothetical protein